MCSFYSLKNDEDTAFCNLHKQACVSQQSFDSQFLYKTDEMYTRSVNKGDEGNTAAYSDAKLLSTRSLKTGGNRIKVSILSISIISRT